MVHVIKGKTCPEVWLKACEYLLDKDVPKYEDYNLLLDIKSPFEISENDKIIFNLVDEFLGSKGGKRLDTVADTIFPSSFYKNGFDHMIEEYPKFIEKLPKKCLGSWGSTYAYRLMQTKELDGKNFSPIKKIIENIRKNSSHGKRHELNLTSFDGDIRIYDPNKGDDKFMGGPCLSHISIKVINSEFINLTALYRNHFYIERLLGNLIGLSKLQSCIAQETNLKPGCLVIHSTAATLDRKSQCWGIDDIRTLLQDIKCEHQKAA
ncbi:MAG: hypothetical protein HOO93_02195 [Methyloglobulus sp.]|nr:hypothetical protein [Methyloglobulus sp.]